MSTSTSSGAFVAAMSAPGLTKAGVKGSDVYTEDGVCLGDGRVALFQQLVRGCTASYIHDAVTKAFASKTATDDAVLRDYFVMAFQTRDIRGGKGERDVFYAMLFSLFTQRPGLIGTLIDLIPEYGCWLDCWKLWTAVDDSVAATHASAVKDAIKSLVKRTWFADTVRGILSIAAEGEGKSGSPLDAWRPDGKHGKSISLLAKWIPREKSKFHALAVEFADMLFTEIEDPNDRLRAYRKACATLNQRLKTCEVAMCGGAWASIEPGKVPGRLLNKCRSAFLNEIRGRKGKPNPNHGELRHPESADRMACREHFTSHMSAALRGEATVKGAETVYPHEIVSKYMGWGGDVEKAEEELLQAQWNAIRDFTAAQGGLAGAVPMCDFSGSMSGIPMNVSMALGILISEINHPSFRDGMIGFDSTPSWIQFKPEMTLKEKVEYARRFAQGTSTDFQAACDLILRRLVEYKVPKEEAPKDMIVFTDMGFDAACGGAYVRKTKPWETHAEMIKNSFAREGYTAPRIVLWNLRAEYKDFHAKADEEGVVLLSGWSPAILKAIQKAGVEVKTAYQGMRELLDDARYDAVRASVAAALGTPRPALVV